MIVSPLLHKGVVHIPTTYKIASEGFFCEHAPLTSVPVEQTETLRQAVLDAIERGNPLMNRDEFGTLSRSRAAPMLAATGARSWNALDRQMQGSWSVTDRNGVYEIRVDQPMQPRGWHEDKTKRVEFPPGTPVDDVITRLIAMIQERARQ
jgi:hypothetical protein